MSFVNPIKYLVYLDSNLLCDVNTCEYNHYMCLPCYLGFLLIVVKVTC